MVSSQLIYRYGDWLFVVITVLGWKLDERLLLMNLQPSDNFTLTR